jgi:acylphosphatase
MDSRPSPGAARRAVVRGRVQGVWFRASTAERATALGIRGRAENQADGSVLVHAAGDAAALDALVEWLHRGPPMARVDAVEVEAIEPGSREWPEGFLGR